MKNRQSLRIKLKAFHERLLIRSINELIDLARRNGIDICGPIPLPVKISKYIVNKSPHKDKKSREQFGLKVHKRLIILSRLDDRLMRVLTGAQLPSGVEVEIKVV